MSKGDILIPPAFLAWLSVGGVFTCRLSGLVKTHGVQIKVGGAIMRERLYQALHMLPPNAYEGKGCGLKFRGVVIANGHNMDKFNITIIYSHRNVYFLPSPFRWLYNIFETYIASTSELQVSSSEHECLVQFEWHMVPPMFVYRTVWSLVHSAVLGPLLCAAHMKPGSQCPASLSFGVKLHYHLRLWMGNVDAVCVSMKPNSSLLLFDTFLV